MTSDVTKPRRPQPEKVFCRWTALMEQYPEWRVGQALFQAVYLLRPDLATRLQVTELDPYHFDANVGPAIGWLLTHWNDDETEPREIVVMEE